MSVFTERSELLDTLEFQLGRHRGRLAAAMNILADAVILVGAHQAYCRSARGADRPLPDLVQALTHLNHARELVASLLTPEHGPGDTPPVRA